MEIALQTYALARILPESEKYGLKSQICRAAVSIPSNIAEGCSWNSEKDFKRFLEIAIGSAFELETQLILIKELEYVDFEKTMNLLSRLDTEQKKINAFINKLRPITPKANSKQPIAKSRV